MTTGPNTLQKRIRREFSIPAEWGRRRDGETTTEMIERWQKRQDEQIAALIAAEVRKAQAGAWDEGWEQGMAYVMGMERGTDDDHTTTNPYRASDGK